MNQNNSDQLILKLRQYMGNANNMLNNKQYTDLNELNSIAGDLCAGINDMELKEASKYADDLQKLVDELDNLKDKMIAHRDDVKGQISNISNKSKASKAYAKSDNMPTSGMSPRNKNDDNNQ